MTEPRTATKPRPTRRDHRAKADKYYSLLIRDRDGQCVGQPLQPNICTNPHHLQCAHIVPRTYPTTRCDPDNAITLCRPCHTFWTYHPLEWTIAVNTLIRPGHYQTIRNRAIQHTPINWRTVATRLEHAWTTGQPFPPLTSPQE